MAKFYGKIGYGFPLETSPGVFEDHIVERKCVGDVLNMSKNTVLNGDYNPSFKVNNHLSLVADAFATTNFARIRYVLWDGVYWTVTSVTVSRPRLTLFIGEVYDGPTA